MISLQSTAPLITTVFCLEHVGRFEALSYLGRLLWSIVLYSLDANRCIQGIVCTANFIGATIVTKIFFNRTNMMRKPYTKTLSIFSMIIMILLTAYMRFYLPKLDLMNRIPLFWASGTIGVLASYNPIWGVGVRIFGYSLPYSSIIMYSIMIGAKFFGDTIV